MSYSKQGNTSRFNFGITRNTTAKKAGSNLFSISTRPADGQQYAVGTTQMSMTIREAQALRKFLNSNLEAEITE